MDNISTLFGIPIYIVDLEPTSISTDMQYIQSNIDSITEYSNEFTVNDTVWTTTHSIIPDQIPQICSKIIEHSTIYAEQIGVPLSHRYSYWFNKWVANNPECTNDRHTHTSSKIVATIYISNNEPTGSTLRLENPMQNILAFTPFHNMADKPWWKQIVDVDTPANRLILWPGFLWHWARYTNNPEAYRVSMAVEVN